MIARGQRKWPVLLDERDTAMHPVTSELDLAVRNYERQLEAQAVRRQGLARDAARQSSHVGPIARLVQAARRYLDPRGYAFDQALRIEAPARRTPQVASPVAPFPESAGGTLRKAA